jgi:hypothetical protein
MLDMSNIFCIIAHEKSNMGTISFMSKLKTSRILLFVLLSLFLFACFSISRPAGHAATEAAGAVAETSEENGEYMIFAPVVSTQQWLTNCRYGVGNKSNQPAKDWIDYLGAGHYINFEPRFYGPPIRESIEFLPQIRIRQDRQDGQFLNSYTVDPPLTMDPGGLGSLLKQYPASTWLAGNEPDVDNSSQDRIFPELYAEGYHEVYNYIKQNDPEAQVAIAGLSMMTPGRLQYLDKVWNAYLNKYGEPMPVDVWNMHLYILAEINPETGAYADGKVALGTDPNLAKKSPVGLASSECPKDDVYCRAEHDDVEIFKEQILRMRIWMKNHGQQDKPLILSEYSLLYPFVDFDHPINPTECFLMDEFGKCFTEPRVTSYLHKTVDFLEQTKDPTLGYPADDYRLVQQWTWYSMWIDPEMAGDSSNLLIDGYQNRPLWSDAGLTQVGRAFRDRARASERTVNLVAGEAPDVQKGVEGLLTDVDLSVSFYNEGSAGIQDSFRVTFYKDAALTQVIGETEVNPRISGFINGCSWDHPTDWASVTWSVPVGTHSFWAKIDSGNSIPGETNESDNVTNGKVTIN